MSLECGTAEGSASVSKATILEELENDEAWQPSGDPWECNF